MPHSRFTSPAVVERREATDRMQERAYQDAMIDMAVDTIVKDRTADYYRFAVSVDDRVHANRILNDHWRRRPAIVAACEWTTAQFFPPKKTGERPDAPRTHFGVIVVPVSGGIQARLQGFLRCPNSLAPKTSQLALHEDQAKREIEVPYGLATLVGALSFRLQSNNLWIANQKLTDGRFLALSENKQNPWQVKSYLGPGLRTGHGLWGEVEFLPQEVFLQVRG